MQPAPSAADVASNFACGKNGGENVISETRYIIKLEERVETPFISNSATQTLTEDLATRCAVTMRRVDNHIIAEF